MAKYYVIIHVQGVWMGGVTHNDLTRSDLEIKIRSWLRSWSNFKLNDILHTKSQNRCAGELKVDLYSASAAFSETRVG